MYSVHCKRRLCVMIMNIPVAFWCSFQSFFKAKVSASGAPPQALMGELTTLPHTPLLGRRGAPPPPPFEILDMRLQVPVWFT